MTAMTERFETLVQEYLDNSLDDAQQRELGELIKSDPELAREFAFMTRMEVLQYHMGQATSAGAGPEQARTLPPDIDTHASSAGAWLAIAASVMLFAVVYIASRSDDQQSPTIPKPVQGRALAMNPTPKQDPVSARTETAAADDKPNPAANTQPESLPDATTIIRKQSATITQETAATQTPALPMPPKGLVPPPPQPRKSTPPRRDRALALDPAQKREPASLSPTATDVNDKPAMAANTQPKPRTDSTTVIQKQPAAVKREMAATQTPTPPMPPKGLVPPPPQPRKSTPPRRNKALASNPTQKQNPASPRPTAAETNDKPAMAAGTQPDTRPAPARPAKPENSPAPVMVAAAPPQGPVAMVAQLDGKAIATSPDQKRRRLHAKSPLRLGDAIRTGRGSKLVIEFSDKTTITIGPRARLTIDEFIYQPGNAESVCKTSISRGAFKVVSGLIAKIAPDRIRIKTPTATIGIRGTTCVGTTDERTTIAVYTEGKAIAVFNSMGQTILTGKTGMGCKVLAGKAPGKARMYKINQIQRITRMVTMQAARNAARAAGRAGIGFHAPAVPHH